MNKMGNNVTCDIIFSMQVYFQLPERINYNYCDEKVKARNKYQQNGYVNLCIIFTFLVGNMSRMQQISMIYGNCIHKLWNLRTVNKMFDVVI